MSNIEENKRLCERYPYLAVHNAWTGEIVENYDYSHIEGDELPNGWHKLWMQLIEDIRQPLIDTEYIDKFRFTQVKEKFGELRAYDANAPKEVLAIIDKYEWLSNFICEDCGQPAEYTTSGWIINYCSSCLKKHGYTKKGAKKIKFKPIMTQYRYQSGVKKPTREDIDCSDEWGRLFECN